MRKSIFAILFLLLACISQETPKGILTKDKMVRVLIDVHIAEGKVTKSRVANPDSAAMLYREYENEIFKKYRISKKAYKESFKYYENHPQLFDEVYSRVVDSLSLRQKLLKID